MYKKVFLASDHAGFELKEALESFLGERGFDVEDLGPSVYAKDDDYPDTIAPLARAVAEHTDASGVAIGASGQGEAMAANRFRGVRAEVYYGPARGNQIDASGKALSILLSPRAHQNANVLCLAARFLTQDEAKEAVIEWLTTDFSGEERHLRRIRKLDQ